MWIKDLVFWKVFATRRLRSRTLTPRFSLSEFVMTTLWYNRIPLGVTPNKPNVGCLLIFWIFIVIGANEREKRKVKFIVLKQFSTWKFWIVHSKLTGFSLKNNQIFHLKITTNVCDFRTIILISIGHGLPNRGHWSRYQEKFKGTSWSQEIHCTSFWLITSHAFNFSTISFHYFVNVLNCVEVLTMHNFFSGNGVTVRKKNMRSGF